MIGLVVVGQDFLVLTSGRHYGRVSRLEVERMVKKVAEKERKKKPDPEPAPATSNVPDWDQVKGLNKTEKVGGEFGSLTIAGIAREYRRIRAEEKMLAAQKTLLSEAGVRLLARANVKSVLVDELPVTRKDGVSARFNKKRYAELGGDLDIYDKAIVRKPYTSLSVKSADDKEEDDVE